MYSKIRTQKFAKFLAAGILAGIILLLAQGSTIVRAETEMPEPTPTLTATPSEAASEDPTDLPEPTETLTPTVTPTLLPSATPTSTPAPTQPPYLRPMVVINDYRQDLDEISAGDVFGLRVRLVNSGQLDAYNLVVSFQSSDLAALNSGGVIPLAKLPAGEKASVSQQFSAGAAVAGKDFTNVEVQLSYADQNGMSYAEHFSLSLPVKSVSAPVVESPSPDARAQLVVSSYQVDKEYLEPGNQFSLQLQIRNLGGDTARETVLMLGGSDNDFSVFAPMGTSNVQYLGDLESGDQLAVSYALIANTTAKPGAYPLNFSLVYTDESGTQYTDTQVITLLLYDLPDLEISFYGNLPAYQVGQAAPLPLQVINLGNDSVMLGQILISGDGAIFSNQTSLVGALDAGGFYTLEANLTPQQAGILELTVEIRYLDDFNQPQTLTRTLGLEVLEIPTPAPAPVSDQGEDPGQNISAPPDNFWTKVWRLLLGFLGLDGRG